MLRKPILRLASKYSYVLENDTGAVKNVRGCAKCVPHPHGPLVIYNDLHSIIYNDSVIIMSGSETQLHDDLLLSERSLLFSQ